MSKIKEIFLQKQKELGSFEGFSSADPDNYNEPNDPSIPLSNDEIVEIERKIGFAFWL